MIPGFEKIVEERIKRAQKKGCFNNLCGKGKRLKLENDRHVPEEMRLAFKILKNAGFVPPEIELKKEIHQTKDLLAGVKDVAEKHRMIKKLNFLVMKLNATRNSSIHFEMPQHYFSKVVNHMSTTFSGRGK